ncbi:NAD-dependent epimerase/dehydratase family protein [Mangrovibrevibacter kandeliae]|uniref:NAD-dependent epimerase/dehydratase family protein n=1 Tax=Mangrovibrevibacter kandeliae TaxID=2968473 RepID=UPI002117A185|nr:NAD(P)-dependent oxidoreductase [Aurantimonas sp. CSK15Z-1]MCQ8780674.1 NAD(P)-dependent oxidoreductase [Aurantimonas sp. CSK15Z-1]
MLERLLITGAAGGLGRLARSRLKHLARTLRLSDVAPMEAPGEGEEVIQCNLGDRQAVRDLVAGCDGILHLGGVSVERTFDEICEANLVGVYNLYEAARAAGQPRILFASSNHTIGFYTQDVRLQVDDPHRPDSLYGVSKCFGEAMSSLYFDKFGQETALVRIGSCFPEPRDHRMLATWLSPDDFVSLVECVFRAPRIGRPIVWGVSNNQATWWDNSSAAFLGWQPKDSSEAFRAKIDAAMSVPDKDAVDAVYQGGKFCAEPIHES